MNKEFRCHICNVCFTRIGHLNKHYLSLGHKRKEEQDNTLKKEQNNSSDNSEDFLKSKINKLELELSNLRKSVTYLTEKLLVISSKQVSSSGNTINITHNTHNNTHNTHNTNTNTTIHISVNPYGKEDISYLVNEIPKMLESPHTCIPRIFEKIYFDKEHPENHNIRLKSHRDTKIQFHDGKNWQWANKKSFICNDVIPKLVNTAEDHESTFMENINHVNRVRLWEEKKEKLRNNKKEQKDMANKIEQTILNKQIENKNK